MNAPHTPVEEHGPPSSTVSTAAPAPERPPQRTLVSTTVRRLGLIPYSGLYALAILIVFFGLTESDLFLTETNLKVILFNSAITGFLAVGVLVPLVAGQLDLSFGSVASFAMVFMAWASTHTDMNTYLLAFLTVLLCGPFGLASGLLTAYLNLDSLIVTLGMSSVALGIAEYITNGNTLTAHVSPSFSKLGLNSFGPFPILAVVLLIFSLLVYIWLEHTAGGRFALACGANPNAARLVGINVQKTKVLSLTFSSLVAGLAGVLLIARIGSATDTGAAGYLLPVVAGIFLGSTQVLSRPNVVGTLIAIYVLGTGVQGIQLHGSEPWVNELFNGAVLLVAVSVAALRRISGGRRSDRNPRHAGQAADMALDRSPPAAST